MKYENHLHIVVPALLLREVNSILLGAEGHTDTLNIVGAARVKLSCYEHILGVGSTDEEA